MGSYTTVKNGKKVTVGFTDGQVVRDMSDLWAIIEGDYHGTPSTEGQIVEGILRDLQLGKPLNDAEFGLYSKLMKKYGSELEDFRAGPDNDTQGFVPIPSTGKIMESLPLLPPSLRERLREAEAPSTGAVR